MTHTEVALLMEILEDAYWRLKDLDEQDLEAEEDLEERVQGIITGLDPFFA